MAQSVLESEAHLEAEIKDALPEKTSPSNASTCAPFDNILNFRDVGKTINNYTGKRLIVEGQLFRSARPDDASLSDRSRLQDDFGIKTVMDLRTKSEHDKQAKKRDADIATPAILASNEALAGPLQIPGMEYLEININGKAFEHFLVKQLSAWSFVKLVSLMACGYRTEAIGIMAREVMTPRGLVGLGCDTMDYCGAEIVTALRALYSHHPVMVHCTQGKDRTGLIVALVLFLLEVPVDAISYDYTLSESELLPELEGRLSEMREMGFSDEFARTPKEWMGSIDEHIKTKYGGIVGYMDSIGFDADDRAKLLELLKVQ